MYHKRTHSAQIHPLLRTSRLFSLCLLTGASCAEINYSVGCLSKTKNSLPFINCCHVTHYVFVEPSGIFYNVILWGVPLVLTGWRKRNWTAHCLQHLVHKKTCAWRAAVFSESNWSASWSVWSSFTPSSGYGSSSEKATDSGCPRWTQMKKVPCKLHYSDSFFEIVVLWTPGSGQTPPISPDNYMHNTLSLFYTYCTLYTCVGSLWSNQLNLYFNFKTC